MASITTSPFDLQASCFGHVTHWHLGALLFATEVELLDATGRSDTVRSSLRCSTGLTWELRKDSVYAISDLARAANRLAIEGVSRHIDTRRGEYYEHPLLVDPPFAVIHIAFSETCEILMEWRNQLLFKLSDDQHPRSSPEQRRQDEAYLADILERLGHCINTLDLLVPASGGGLDRPGAPRTMAGRRRADRERSGESPVPGCGQGAALRPSAGPAAGAGDGPAHPAECVRTGERACRAHRRGTGLRTRGACPDAGRGRVHAPHPGGTRPGPRRGGARAAGPDQRHGPGRVRRDTTGAHHRLAARGEPCHAARWADGICFRRAGASSIGATRRTWPRGCSGMRSTRPQRASPAADARRPAPGQLPAAPRRPSRHAGFRRGRCHARRHPSAVRPARRRRACGGWAAGRLARQVEALAPDAEVDPSLIVELLHPIVATAAADSFTYSRPWLRALMAHFTEPRFAAALRNLTPPPEYALVWRATLSAAGLFAQLGATVPTRGFHLAYSPGFRGGVPSAPAAADTPASRRAS